MSETRHDNELVNPIDPDKVAENPGMLPYAHHVGSAQIKPVDKGKVRSRALVAMAEQTQTQLKQIYEQMELLARQAKDIQKRVELSNRIYAADISFEPIIGKTYHLYGKGDGYVLSMIGENEWHKQVPYDEFISSVRMMADHTWQVV